MKAILKFEREDFTFTLPLQNKEFREAILEYDLMEEGHEFKTACMAREYACALWDIKAFIRIQLKHGITMSDEELLETIRELIPKDDDL